MRRPAASGRRHGLGGLDRRGNLRLLALCGRGGLGRRVLGGLGLLALGRRVLDGLRLLVLGRLGRRVLGELRLVALRGLGRRILGGLRLPRRGVGLRSHRLGHDLDGRLGLRGGGHDLGGRAGGPGGRTAPAAHSSVQAVDMLARRTAIRGDSSV